ncbi:hypothetical protein LCGC14_1303180 [marine sediment metagenome]|uniref:Uncharacterized protein n=1 Tax=marine sediment metagenome TaxID=412755 RepID=A0A0F9KQ70_9ZZZZ
MNQVNESNLFFNSKFKFGLILCIVAFLCIGGLVHEKSKKRPTYTGYLLSQGKVYYFNDGRGGELS